MSGQFVPHDGFGNVDMFDVQNMAQMEGIGGMRQPARPTGHRSFAEQGQPQGQPDEWMLRGGQPAKPEGDGGEVLEVFDMLWTAYSSWVEGKLEARRLAGEKVKDLRQALLTAPATHFLDFCVRYMGRRRPIGADVVGNDIVLETSEGVRFKFPAAPPAQQVAGHGGVVAVTGGGQEATQTHRPGSVAVT